MKIVALHKVIVIGFLLLFFVNNQAHAAIIDVGCDTAEFAAAIVTANGTPAADALNLAADCTYSFTVGDATNADSALPRVTTPIDINGNGATIERASGAATNFRLFYVTSTGNLSLDNVTITGGSGMHGGGILNDDGILTVTNAVFDSNVITNNGGAITNLGGAATVVDSVFTDNSATFGGAILNGSTGSTLVIVGSRFTGNAANYGGAIHSETGTTTIVDSTFAANTANNGGGAIMNRDVMTITGSVITGNRSSLTAGGIYSEDVGVPVTTLTVINTTIAGNVAPNDGGVRNTAGAVTVTNSILWGNGDSQLTSTTTATVSYSVVQTFSAWPGTGNRNDDPLFVSPVDFMSAPTTTGDYRLQADSPALNRGNTAALPADTYDVDGDSNSAEAYPIDRDGNPRVVNLVVDIGAYEHQVLAGVVANSASASVMEGGADDAYGIRLASRPTDDVTVNVDSGGETTVDPPSLTFTPDDWSVDQIVTITAVDDTNIEGTHGDTVTHSATSSDGAYNGIAGPNVDVTVLELSGELLVNGDFELNVDGNNKLPDGWTLKTGSGDKLACNPALAHSGNCAMKFKGSVSESSKLIQNVDLSSTPLGFGDLLTLSAYFNGNNAAIKGKLILSVKYAGNPSAIKSSASFGPNASYTQVSVPSFMATAPVESIVVTLNHKSKGSKLYVDDISLTRAVPRDARSDVLPPPPAPSGMRGLN